MDHERRFVLEDSEAAPNEALCQWKEGFSELLVGLKVTKNPA
jgi:hypothetical protein